MSGGGVYVSNNGTFHMYAGTISGNSAVGGNGGGVYVDAGGVFTLSGGTITNNTVTNNSDFNGGAGVYLYKATFTMTDGTITDNTASGTLSSGGGVYANTSTFTMTGGSITGNAASQYGDGVVMIHSTFNVADTPNITGNNGSNLYLLKGEQLTVTGVLSDNAIIGISMDTLSDAVATGDSSYGGDTTFALGDIDNEFFATLDSDSGAFFFRNALVATQNITTIDYDASGIDVSQMFTFSYDGNTISDLPLTYTIAAEGTDTGEGTLDGSILTVSTSGTISIKATYAGSAAYLPITQVFTLLVNAQTVTNLDLTSLLPAPVNDQTPATTIDNAQYTGTIVWSPSSSEFLSSTVYTATITLTATDNYTFNGVASNAFAYTGATSVSNDANSGTVTIVFAATQTRIVSKLEITTAPTTTWYITGDTFDATGMVVTVTYTDGTSAIITDYSYDGDATNLQLGDSVTITYGGKTATQALTVIDPLTEEEMCTLLDFVAGFETPTAAQLAQLDSNEDNALTIKDAIFFARFM